MRLAQPWAMAVTPATRSLPVFTSLWHFANDGSRFHVTFSESGWVAGGGSLLLSVAGFGVTGPVPVSEPPPPQAANEATRARAANGRRVFRMAEARGYDTSTRRCHRVTERRQAAFPRLCRRPCPRACPLPRPAPRPGTSRTDRRRPDPR